MILSAVFRRSATPYFDGPQAPIGRPEVFVGEILPTENSPNGLYLPVHIGQINGVDNIPADSLTHGTNSFLLGPSIDILTFSREQQKDEHLQCILREKNTALQQVMISNPDITEKIICNTSMVKLRPYALASLCKDIFTVVHSLSHPGANASVCC